MLIYPNLLATLRLPNKSFPPILHPHPQTNNSTHHIPLPLPLNPALTPPCQPLRFLRPHPRGTTRAKPLNINPLILANRTPTQRARDPLAALQTLRAALQHAAPAGTSLDEGADAVRAAQVVGEGVAAHVVDWGFGQAVLRCRSEKLGVDEWLSEKENKTSETEGA